MNPRNRRMFRPKNAGKQAAGILASSPQLMQTVQKRANGGANFNPQLASIALQNLTGSARNLEEARRLALANQPATQPTFFGQPAGAAKFGGSTYGGMTFGGNNPRLKDIIPSGPPQKGPGDIFSTIGNLFRPLPQFRSEPDAPESLAEGVPGTELPKDFTASQGIGSVIPGRAFEKIDDKVRFGTDSAELGFEDADDDSTLSPIIADVLSNKLMSEELQEKAVTASGDQTQTDKDTRKKKVLPPESQDTSTKAETSGSSLTAAQARLDKFAKEQSTKGSSDVKPQIKTEEQAALPEAGKALTELLKNKPEIKAATFSDVEESVKEMMGFDPDKTSEDKKDAIYMNMMMAGLSIAAGESDNPLTNIANGLRAGLAGYAKDIKDIDARDAELQKEFRASMRDAVKNENDVRKAQATLDNTYNTAIANIKANQENVLAGITSREKIAEESLNFQKEEAAINNAYRQQTFELAIINAQNTLDINIKELGLQRDTLDFNKQKEISDNFFRQAELQLNSAPEEAIQAAYLGPEFATQNEDGTFSLTDKGREQFTLLLAANLADPDDKTDLDKKSIALGKVFNGTAGPLDRAYAMTHPAFTSLNKEVQNVEETFEMLKAEQSQQPAVGSGDADPLGLSN